MPGPFEAQSKLKPRPPKENCLRGQNGKRTVKMPL